MNKPFIERIKEMSDEALDKEIMSKEINDAARQMILYEKTNREIKNLAKPHWTVQPNFWITTVSAIAAIVAAYFAWLAVRPVAPLPPPGVAVSPSSSSQTPPQVPATSRP